MEKKVEISVPMISERMRLDVFLAKSDLGCSRSKAQQLIAEGLVTVNGQKRKASHILKPDDKISVLISEPKRSSLDPEDIPLDILFEDEDLLVVNKPSGMIVHPAGRVCSGTLVNALLFHCGNLSRIGGAFRPGIVHRLDRGTSGLLMVAKNDRTHVSLTAQVQKRTIARSYRALVWGRMKAPSGRIEPPIGRHPSDGKRMAVTQSRSRHAVTEFSVEEEFDFLSLLSLRLGTGRTHQIRVHLSHIGHPIFGDPVYGGREKRLRGTAPQFRSKARVLLKAISRPALHAETLGFLHPRTGEFLEFSAKMPEDMEKVLRMVRGPNYAHPSDMVHP